MWVKMGIMGREALKVVEGGAVEHWGDSVDGGSGQHGQGGRCGEPWAMRLTVGSRWGHLYQLTILYHTLMRHLELI